MSRSGARGVLFGTISVLAVLVGAAGLAQAVTFAGPTSSQPIALDALDDTLGVVSPDTDSVMFFSVIKNHKKKLARLAVQDEPWGIAILPDGSKAYVANTASGTVSVVTRDAKKKLVAPTLHIPVGTEPYGLALTPNGTRLYVANARSDTISVIDTATDTVVKTIFGVGPEPRGLAITNDGDADDTDETVFVTQFLARPVSGKSDGADDGKEGHVIVIATATNTVTNDIVVYPLVDTGFFANGDALGRVPPGASFLHVTGAYPNQLNSIVIHGGFVYAPSTGASSNGPVRFDVNVQSLVSVLNAASLSDTLQTVNLNQAVQNQTNPAKRFLTVPWAMAFEHTAGVGWVVSAASDVLVRVDVAAGTGAVAVANDPRDPTRVLEIPTGKNPRGIVVNAADTRAFVMNYVSRDVTIVDLTASPERAVKKIVVEKLPKKKTLDATIQLGKELFNTSIGGPFDRHGAKKPIVGRMAKDGWGACAACHPFGLSDQVVWIFPSGPRRTISLHTDFDPTDPTRVSQRALGWSAIFDEETDLERYIRDVSGGDGLLVQADRVSPEPNVPALMTLANTGRPQLQVKKQNAWEAIELYVKFGIRAPISPVAKTDPDVISGRALFIAANCQSCHGGPLWTSSKVRYTPPAAAALVNSGQLIGELRAVGTFSSFVFNEVTADAGTPLGASGFAPASLLSVATSPTFLHNGAALSLDEVLQNVTHRSNGTSGVDTLSNAADRAKIATFLRSIDAATTPILGF